MNFSHNKFRLASKKIIDDNNEIDHNNEMLSINNPEIPISDSVVSDSGVEISDKPIMVDKSTDTNDLQFKDINEYPTNMYAIRTSQNYSKIQTILSEVKSSNIIEYMQILKGLNSLLDIKHSNNPRNEMIKQKRDILLNKLKNK